MKIDVISTSLPGNKTKKEEFNKFSGHCAGICYMADTFENIKNLFSSSISLGIRYVFMYSTHPFKNYIMLNMIQKFQ